MGSFSALGAVRVCAVAFAPVVIVGSCGLYGEKGFTGKNPLSSARFIEEVDEQCADMNESLDAELAFVTGDGQPGDKEPKKLADDLRSKLDDLIDDIEEIYGPDRLEGARDTYSHTLDRVRDQLEVVADAADDGDEPRLQTSIAEVKSTLVAAETELRTAGFKVCGVPRPAGTDATSPSS